MEMDRVVQSERTALEREDDGLTPSLEEMMTERTTRKSNTVCQVCGVGVYRRPSELRARVYCSNTCRWSKEGAGTKGTGKRIHNRTCPVCEKTFKGKLHQRFCSRSCVSKVPPDSNIKVGGRSSRTARLKKLQTLSGVTTCMVEGCTYNRTLDLHRLNPGCLGGEYTDGNTFAICPNHHSELHRRVIKLIKVGEFRLQATDI